MKRLLYPLASSPEQGQPWFRLLEMAQPAKSKRISAWNLLLLVPALALIFPGVYARATPEVFGIPFFYWYQFVWIVLTGIITAIVYRATPD